MELLKDEVRRAIHQAVLSWFKAEMTKLNTLFDEPKHSGPLSGVLYILRSNLGIVHRRHIVTLLPELSKADRRHLTQLDIKLGFHYAFAAPALKPAFMPIRAACWAAWLKCSAPALPDKKATHISDWTDDFAEAFGYPRVATRCIRVDMFERASAHLRQSIRKGPTPIPLRPMRWLGCKRNEWDQIVAGFGFQIREDGVYPPPRRRKKHKR